jgi:hypothetical protein
MSVSAYSLIVESGSVGDVTATYRTGESAGFTFWYEGGVGICGGRRRAARAIAAWTSWAAASMFRESANWSVICDAPWKLVDVIESIPAIVENSRSSGVATELAIVSGLAPGSAALTWMVGKSTFGRSLTGSSRYAIVPNTAIPTTSSVVITGRRMHSSDTFIGSRSRAEPACSRPACRGLAAAGPR